MGDPPYARVREVFHEVCTLDGEERAHRVDSLCGSDEGLRSEVQRLLAAMDLSGVSDPRLTGVEFRDAPAPRIEGYRVLRLLGEGGMGVVYEATQETPRRRVALKVIRPGLVTETLLKRFRRESEILAKLNHSGIAQVYEVGLGGEGKTPFIAMELVEGCSLLEFCAGLGTREKLQLACELCDAVDHAHRRGVVHRDLKPANILVDPTGRAKILDFGVARFAGADAGVTLQTQAGQIIGTAAYMSPEQASGDPDAVDVRSDVYALGAVIYEMLSGRLPHRVGRLALADAIRVIREEEPTRIGTVDTSLRGDVDTILGKALEREPSRRYQSAGELAADIRRHLGDLPIVARPASTWYQLRKFARRHKALVGGTAGVIIALSGGLVATGMALRSESLALARAEESLERAGAASAFLERVLLGVAPHQAQGRDTTLLREMLDAALAEARSGLNHPSVKAEMLWIVGDTYRAIFEFEQAEVALREAEAIYAGLGAGSRPELQRVRLTLADAITQTGQTTEAERLLRGVLTEISGTGRVEDELHAIRQLGEIQMDRADLDAALETVNQADPLLDRVSLIDRGRVSMLRGAILRRMGRLNEAGNAYEQALALYRKAGAAIEASSTLNSIALVAREERRLADAEAAFRESLRARESVDPRANPDAATTLANLGRLLASQERLEEAATVLARSIAMHRDLYGDEHFSLAIPLVSLAQVQSKLGRHDEAIGAIEQGLGLVIAQFGEAHPYVVTTLSEKADAERRGARLKEARATYERAIRMSGTLGLPPSVFDLPIRCGLIETLLLLDLRSQAVACYEQGVEILGDDETGIAELRSRMLELGVLQPPD